jgi:hypothetical protein
MTLKGSNMTGHFNPVHIPLLMVSCAIHCLQAQGLPSINLAGTSSLYYGDDRKAVAVVPGELRTFGVPGLTAEIAEPFYVKERPLPDEVFGISVRLEGPDVETPLRVPIYALRQVNYCASAAASPGCRATFITVQIPVETSLDLPKPFSEPFRGIARLQFLEGGEPRVDLPIYTERDQLRILNTCDYMFEVNEGGRYCLPLVRRSNGVLSTVWEAGEKVSILLSGIYSGSSGGRIRTGEPSPDDPPLTANILVWLRQGLNLGPSVPAFRANSYQDPLRVPRTPVTLVPGEFGVYQLDLTAPPAPSNSSENCPDMFFTARSNYTYTITANAGTILSLPGQPREDQGLGVCVGHFSETPEMDRAIEQNRGRR